LTTWIDTCASRLIHIFRGFVASDTLFLALNERAASDNPEAPLFPNIHGVLAFDTPYNGLSRSMFVYGAFSNYSKVSSVFNVMTALSTAPAAIGKLAMSGARNSLPRAVSGGAGTSRNPGWKAWQLIAVRTGTVGAIAAGGVAAYVHRKQIMEGMRSMRNLNKKSLVDGYQSSVDALGQGLAYVNRGNVGESFAWLSDHFTFVGALMKQTELNRRLERSAALKGVGIRDFYCSLGENGYWSGGYFVPERTFCAVPEKDEPPHALFDRWVVKNADDEIQAHISMFQPQQNSEYDVMTAEAAKWVIKWFESKEPVFEDPKFALPEPEPAEEAAIKATDEGVEIEGEEKLADVAEAAAQREPEASELPDESPVDIAAAASFVPLPEDGNDDQALKDMAPAEKEKATYMRHLFGVAQQAGTGLKRVSDWSSSFQLPAKMPKIDGISTSSIKMPAMPVLTKPSIPSMPTMPTMPMMNIFTPKEKSDAGSSQQSAVEEDRDSTATDGDVSVPAPIEAAGLSTKEPTTTEGNQ